MATELTDRASLLRQLQRLINTDLEDDGATEYDPDATPYEGLYLILERGARLAQQFMIGAGLGEYWLTVSSSALSWSGSDAADQGRYATLPTDFLRGYGDRWNSCLHQLDGTTWGKEVHPRDRLAQTGNGYYFAQGKIWILRRASLPGDLYIDYYRRITELSDGTDVDFPADDRELICAFAALEASRHPWFLGGQEEKADLREHLRDLKNEVHQRARRSRQPRGPRLRPKIGLRYY